MVLFFFSLKLNNFCRSRFCCPVLNADDKLYYLEGNDTGSGAPRNRVGQISHSVVLGTFNVGEQGEGIVQDLTRVRYCVICIYFE